MTRRYYANAAPQQTLSAQITSGATSCTVASSFSGWPVQFPFFAALDLGTASMEIVSVTAIVGTTATIVRAQDGTAAISHPAGATVDQVFIRQDMDEANAHINANTGVHGISGAVVGTSDSQTLSNKTLASPALTGTLTGAGAINTTGTITTTQALASGAATITGALATSGASTAASYTANGNGAVTGVVVPKSYTNEAAATAALPSPAAQALIWLTAPTGGGIAGLYYWSGAAWAPVTPGFCYGDTTTGASVTLSTTSEVASTASVTFTLPVQRRVRIEINCAYTANTAPGHIQAWAGYNSGNSVVIGSVTRIGQRAILTTATTGANGGVSGVASGTVVLAAGQYTAYQAITRATGGATDIAQLFYVGVFDAGAS